MIAVQQLYQAVQYFVRSRLRLSRAKPYWRLPHRLDSDIPKPFEYSADRASISARLLNKLALVFSIAIKA